MPLRKLGDASPPPPRHLYPPPAPPKKLKFGKLHEFIGLPHGLIIVILWSLPLLPIALYALAYIEFLDKYLRLLMVYGAIWMLLLGMPVLAVASILWTANYWADALSTRKEKTAGLFQSWIWPVLGGSLLSLVSTGAGALSLFMRWREGGLFGKEYFRYEFLWLMAVGTIGGPLLIGYVIFQRKQPLKDRSSQER